MLASPYDGDARYLVEEWSGAGHEVGLVTPEALSRPGWRLHVGKPEAASAAIGDRVIQGTEIAGVVTTLKSVEGWHLADVLPDDREYVAQEMTAFLLAWLTQLRCPVLDRPSPRSLSGCGRSAGEWKEIARRQRLQCIGHDSASPLLPVTVVGGAAVDAPTRALRAAGESLARAGHRDLVTLLFTNTDTPMFAGVTDRPLVGTAAVAAALLTAIAQ